MNLINFSAKTENFLHIKKRYITCSARQVNIVTRPARRAVNILPVNFYEICPGLNATENQIAYDKHHKVSSLVKSHQSTHDSVKYEVI